MLSELVKELVEAGAFYGHQSFKWHPRVAPYILETKKKIHIINLEKTTEQIQKASDYISDCIRNSKEVVFVGCKRQAQDAIKSAAQATSQHYVNHRWLGGMLTNLKTVRQSVNRLEYLEDIEQSDDYAKMSKKELASLNRKRLKLTRSLGGVRNMKRLPACVVVVDALNEHVAVKEAQRLNIPVVALLDTNTDPESVEFPIVCNDDSIRSITVVLKKLVDDILKTLEGMSAKERAEIELAKVD